MLDSLKKIGGMFVEVENKPATPKPAQENNISAVPGFSVPGIVTPAPVSNRSVGTDLAYSQEQDEKFRKHFQDLMEARNLPGPDYLEFHKLLEQFAALPTDEITKIKTAFASLAVMGIDKVKLIESAKHYLNVLENDKRIFLDDVSRKQSQDVGGRDAEIASLKAEIDKNNIAMQDLAKKNSDNIARMEQLTQEKIKAEENIRNKQQGYVLHSEGMISKINNDISKIQTNL